MEMLPPAGGADVATKADLEHLRAMMAKDVEITEIRLGADIKSAIGRLEVRFSRALRALFVTSLTANTAMVALIVSVAKAF